jgi:hypothetical protein
MLFVVEMQKVEQFVVAFKSGGRDKVLKRDALNTRSQGPAVVCGPRCRRHP